MGETPIPAAINLITNGTFDIAADWTLRPLDFISDGRLHLVQEGVNQGQASQQISVPITASYVWHFILSNINTDPAPATGVRMNISGAGSTAQIYEDGEYFFLKNVPIGTPRNFTVNSPVKAGPQDGSVDVDDVWVSKIDESLIYEYGLFPLGSAKYEKWDRGGGLYNYIIADRNGKTNVLVKYDTTLF